MSCSTATYLVLLLVTLVIIFSLPQSDEKPQGDSTHVLGACRWDD